MAAKLQPCGTWAAYTRHIKNHQVPCEPCYAAARDYRARRKSVRRRETAVDELIHRVVHILACELGVGRQP